MKSLGKLSLTKVSVDEKNELVEVESILRSNIDKTLVDLRNTILFTETEKVTDIEKEKAAKEDNLRQ